MITILLSGLPLARITWRSVAVLTLLGAAANAPAQTTNYSITDLGTLGQTSSSATGINDAGQVVGYSGALDGSDSDGVLFNVSGGTVTRTALGGIATGINNSGQIIGYVSDGNAPYGAIFTVSNGTVTQTNLGGINGSYSESFSINNAGQSVGYGGTADNAASHAILYGTSGNNLDLGTPGGATSQAYSLNDSGQIAGYGDIAGNGNPNIPHATLTTVNGATVTRTDLGTLVTGGRSYAAGINDSGKTVGYATTTVATASNVIFHAVLYGTNGNNMDLGTLGGTNSYGLALNKSGQIVGFSDTATGGSHGFIATGSADMTDLNSLVGANPIATDISIDYEGSNLINSFGQIAAFGTVAGGQSHALLLNPSTPMTSRQSTAAAPASQDSRVVGGMSYTQVPSLLNAQTGSNHTTVSFLGGTAGSGGASTYGLNRDVQTAFLGVGGSGQPFSSLLASDRVTLTGTGHDVIVFELTYVQALATTLLGGSANARLDWLSPVTGEYVNAIAGNDAGQAHFVLGSYDPSVDFHLGYYGVDPANGAVWAVLDHNSEFAVSNIDAVPEPSAWLLMSLAALLGGVVWWRRSTN